MERRPRPSEGTPRRARGRLILGLAVTLVWGTPGAAASPSDPTAGASAALDMFVRIAAARKALPPLAWEDGLAAAAARYALELAVRGELSHEGVGGDRAVDRVRAAGYTEARIGEVLGAGPSAAGVLEAWLSSASHRDVIQGVRWTHAGVGAAGDEAARVFVVLLVSREVEELAMQGTAGGDRLLGRLVTRHAVRPLLLVDLERLEALAWEPETGRFVFLFDPAWLGTSYVRLCYVTAGGAVEVTNVLEAGADVPRPPP